MPGGLGYFDTTFLPGLAEEQPKTQDAAATAVRLVGVVL
jgi:uncharacterized membrane protein YbhN (UPF0104 family)